MRAHGIQPLAQEERQLTEEEARQFYSHLKDEVGFLAFSQMSCSAKIL